MYMLSVLVKDKKGNYRNISFNKLSCLYSRQTQMLRESRTDYSFEMPKVEDKEERKRIFRNLPIGKKKDNISELRDSRDEDVNKMYYNNMFLTREMLCNYGYERTQMNVALSQRLAVEVQYKMIAFKAVDLESFKDASLMIRNNDESRTINLFDFVIIFMSMNNGTVIKTRHNCLDNVVSIVQNNKLINGFNTAICKTEEGRYMLMFLDIDRWKDLTITSFLNLSSKGIPELGGSFIGF